MRISDWSSDVCSSDLLKSDLFAGLSGRHYELIVTNPPYVTNDETDALPKEYSHEPDMGLRAGDDGLDLVLKILRDAPLHLSEDGLLVCEVGESERPLVKLLPDVAFAWIVFKVGHWGIFETECAELIQKIGREPCRERACPLEVSRGGA